MIAVGGGDEAAPGPRLQIVFAHQSPDLLVVHDHALLAQRYGDAAIPVSLELVAIENIDSTIAVSSTVLAGRS